MCFREILEMTAKHAATLAVIFSAVALIMNTRAFKLQRRSLQANLFNDIIRRISVLEDQHADIQQGEADRLERWYTRIFNAFENFAFYANRGYLAKDMVTFYSSGIDFYIQQLGKKFPTLLKEFKERRKGEFCELEEYCLRVLKKPLPF